METCAVCEAEVETGEPYETDYLDEEFQAYKATHDGATYYFCSEEHREAFEKAPERFVS